MKESYNIHPLHGSYNRMKVYVIKHTIHAICCTDLLGIEILVKLLTTLKFQRSRIASTARNCSSFKFVCV